MRRIIALCIALLLLPSALAVTVLTPKRTDYADRQAAAERAIRERKVGKYGMVPIYGRDIEDGTYAVQVGSTSPFFKIVEAELTVRGDEMTADITIGSRSYLYVYMGTAEQAGSVPEGDWIPGDEGQRFTVFTIPVPALNAPFDCAAYSRNRQIWYDRQLLIDAADLPGDALAFELPDYELAEKAILAFEPEDTAASDDGEAEAARPAAPEPVTLPRSDGGILRRGQPGRRQRQGQRQLAHAADRPGGQGLRPPALEQPLLRLHGHRRDHLREPDHRRRQFHLRDPYHRDGRPHGGHCGHHGHGRPH